MRSINLNITLKTIRQKKNSCVSGSPTDPKISGPTLDFFFLSFIQSPHTHTSCGNNLLPLHPISPVQNLIN